MQTRTDSILWESCVYTRMTFAMEVIKNLNRIIRELKRIKVGGMEKEGFKYIGITIKQNGEDDNAPKKIH